MKKIKILFGILVVLFAVYSCGGGNHAQREIAYKRNYPMSQVDEEVVPVSEIEVPPDDEKKQDFNTEEYDVIKENPFVSPFNQPLSTFSVDVDRASYANIRRMLNNNQKPIGDAVRIEEMVNYFKYDYPQPAGDAPFSVNLEMGTCPWNAKHKLLLIGLAR